MSNTRNTLFTIITVVVIPLLFFIVLELALRVAGMGTHYEYFNTIDIDGQSYFQENPDFADQFYPPSLNVGPLQNTFEQTDHDDRLRVYVLGGSAAMGFPTKTTVLIDFWRRSSMPCFPINTSRSSIRP